MQEPTGCQSSTNAWRDADAEAATVVYGSGWAHLDGAYIKENKILVRSHNSVYFCISLADISVWFPTLPVQEIQRNIKYMHIFSRSF